MKTKPINEYIAAYKACMELGDIPVAYELLRNSVSTLKTHFEKELGVQYSFGNVSPGYMDFTYFPFFNHFLRDKKLRFGIVLNHRFIRFELWLMGQNAAVQNEYWDLLKASKWNAGRTDKPRYSVLEAILDDAPDFNDMDTLCVSIKSKAVSLAEEIVSHLG